MTEEFGNSDLVCRIEQFFDANHVMALGTTSSSGPHVANLFYVRDGLSLVWVSDSGTRHSQDLSRNSLVAASRMYPTTLLCAGSRLRAMRTWSWKSSNVIGCSTFS